MVPTVEGMLQTFITFWKNSDDVSVENTVIVLWGQTSGEAVQPATGTNNTNHHFRKNRGEYSVR